MEFWLLIILLGLTSYLFFFLLKRNLSKITRTPIWLLWLVLMIPPIIWVSWGLIHGNERPIPTHLVIAPFIISPILYWWLIQWKKIEPEIKKSEPVGQETEIQQASQPPENSQSDRLKPRLIDNQEEAALRDCFPWGMYYLQRIDYRPQAILCLGKLRAVPEVAYKTIKDNVERVFGDRYLLLFQESWRGQPFFALVPNVWQKKSADNLEAEQPLTRPGLAITLMLVTLLTTTNAGLGYSGITPEELESNFSLILQGFYYSFALMAIFAFHELSHYFVALRYKIRATLPYFIPMPLLLGTFGAFTQMRSPVPNRKALFDVAIAGPIGSLIVTIPIIIWGLAHSTVVPIVPDNTSILNFDALDPRFSLILSLLSKIALGSQLEPGMAIDLHPAAVAGYIGLMLAAFNLMPVGQLDGGHIVHAVFGQRTALVVAQVTILLTLLLAIVKQDFLLWGLFLLFIPAGQPALNDVTELNNWRDLLGLLSLVILVLILLPLPATIAGWLSI